MVSGTRHEEPRTSVRAVHRLCAVLVAALAGTAVAQDTAVKVTISDRETYVGVPITLRVIIENAEQHDAPEIPEIDDLTIRSTGGPQRSSQTTIVNGRRSSFVRDTYIYQVVPQRAGEFTIPAVEVNADGTTFRTQSLRIIATKSETDDLLFVEVVGGRDQLYVGEPLDVTLQIFLRPFADQRLNFRMNEGHMWGRIDLQNSSWGVFAEPLQEMYTQRQRPSGKAVIREDSAGNPHRYFVYELRHQTWPQRPGTLDVGDVNIIVNYPVRLGRDRFSLFNDLTIEQTRPLAVQATLSPIEIMPLPTDNRPPQFEGAVGQFTITTSANPTDVAVGEPITLTIQIRGTGRLDTLEPPPLPRVAELTRDFKVPTDPLAGEVRGSAKQFNQSIRALRDDVTEIPRIPFAYFDPQSTEYVTTYSDPIPLTVRPTETVSATEIVDSGAAPRSNGQPLTEVAGGILANYAGSSALLAQQAFTPSWISNALLAVPPLAFVITWIFQRRCLRLHDELYARRRHAKRNALRVIDAAVRGAQTPIPAAITSAVAGYVADRCSLPPGGLTRAEIHARLTSQSIDAGLVDKIDTLLERCEALAYAPAGDEAAHDLAQTARRCIARLEEVRF